MLDLIIYFLLKYTYVLAAVLFLIKSFLFVKNKNKNWKVNQFLFLIPQIFNLPQMQKEQNLKGYKIS